MRPQAQSPVCGWGLLIPPPQVELYQPSPSLIDMQSLKILRWRILAVLERHDGKCLDNLAERRQIADDLADMLEWYLGDRGI